MLVQKKSGNLQSVPAGNRSIDPLPLEWYETNKRILHKRSLAGRDIIMKFLQESPGLMQDDIVYEDDQVIVAIDIIPCEAIVVKPISMNRMAGLCYEIGNRHLPLFLQNDEVLVPFEAPLFSLLNNAGYEPVRANRKLLHPLKTTIVPHGQRTTLFTKLLQLTTPSENE